jgi:hypothetical protein
MMLYLIGCPLTEDITTQSCVLPPPNGWNHLTPKIRTLLDLPSSDFPLGTVGKIINHILVKGSHFPDTQIACAKLIDVDLGLLVLLLLRDKRGPKKDDDP